MNRPLRFGVLGAAKIAPGALIQPAKLGSEATVDLVAARDPERARRYAAEHGIPRVARDYAEVVHDPEIDVIYNPLPMNQHAHWTIEALRAGKHVLCEKPFAANASEAEQMVQVAEETGLLLVEAFHYRYHPLFERILTIVQSGVLGTIRHMEGVFKVAIKDKADLRHRYETAGGATMDLGCYPLHWMRTVAGTEPRVLSASAEQGAPQVDVVMQAELAFPGGITAHMLTSMADHEKFNTSLRVEGQNGTLIVQNPLAPHHGHELRLQQGGEDRVETVEGTGTTYRYQLVAFVDAVRTGKKLPTMGADSIHQMRLIDAVYRAAGLKVRGT
ncbi:MAG TPA: Gfo/Idh/MocA family oxidoreductase [Polyangiaceae bacterium]|nr:Gfo/Idh/MocA family oxidoreductase [Polyangiaceae bacterium]